MEHKLYSNSNTQNRILEAAGEVFAEYGFRCATVRKICERAGVNVAAINYHFGSKEKLYSEVLKYWHEFAMKKYPPLLGVGENAPPEDQLRAFIRSLLFRLFDKGKPAWFGKLMAREMADPTGAFDDLVKGVMRSRYELLASILRKMVGPRVSEEILRLCCSSIVGQCVYYYNNKYIADLHQQDPSSPEEIAKLADHIMHFSLRGLKHYSEASREKVARQATAGHSISTRLAR